MSDTEIIAAGELTALAVSALEQTGMPSADAQTTAHHLVTMDMMGVSTHGVHRLDQYVNRLKVGAVKVLPEIVVEDKGPNLAVIDGGDGQGQVVGQRALDLAMEKAKATGLSYVTARRSSHFGGTASYALIAVKAGLVLISGTGASPALAPFGGRDMKVGNNPFGFAAPASLTDPDGGGLPFVLDMAQSVAARGKMRKLRDAGEKMPLGWALDKDGEPTTDPQAGLDGFIQFMGGYKGYGMALMVDILCGLLSGGVYLDDSKDMWNTEDPAPQGTTHFFLAIDPARLLAPADYNTRMADFRGRIKSTAPFHEGGEVLLPGEIELTLMAERQTSGIPVAAQTMEIVRRLAKAA
ncbi:MAG TPA: hydroxyacid dehydrogenase [Rhodospirillaceae bacterium]|nr:hydroxyacid dehydrogenase [Rhodospirillaceae bacterium]|tara:strand:- start:44 stop:1099 length:1056 start_codon:yes stop_codon:yes gene_type:complete